MWGIVGVVVPVRLRKRLWTLANLTGGCVHLTLGPPQASCGPRERDRLTCGPSRSYLGPSACSAPSLGWPRAHLCRLAMPCQARPFLGVPTLKRGASKATNDGEENKIGKWPKGGVPQLAVTSA